MEVSVEEPPPLPPTSANVPEPPNEEPTPPPLPMDAEEECSPMSCQVSPRGLKREEDIGDDDGAGSPPHKQPRMEPSDHVDLHVIDDVACSDDDEGEAGDGSDSDWMEEVDAMLDEGVKDYKEKKEALAQPVETDKIVLEEKCTDVFEVLPEGWLVLTHRSGMPLYLHKASRVCTLSRPYFLGSGSARRHEIPLSAVPCLQYRRALEDETKEKEIPQGCPVSHKPAENGDNNAANDTSESKSTAESESKSTVDASEEAVVNGDGEVPEKTRNPAANLKPVVKTAEEYFKTNSLSPEDLRKYCEAIFQFKTITVKKFRSWKDKRKHNKAQMQNRPSLPGTTKIITCPVDIGGDKPIKKTKELVLNPLGKSDVCLLHEYVQQGLRLQAKFTFAEMQNAQMPYSSTVMIDGVKYGTGYGSSKKMAKSEAAAKTIEILLPDVVKMRKEAESTKGEEKPHDLAFFDEIRVDDPRVTELSNKAGQPNPYCILGECIKRNHGLLDMKISMEMKTTKHQKGEFTMKLGKHEATVSVRNKREGKQQAAQHILQLLHPHIHCWGSLLRLYGSANKAYKEKKVEENNSNEENLVSSGMALRRTPRRKALSGIQQSSSPTGRGKRIGRRTPEATTPGRALRSREKMGAQKGGEEEVDWEMTETMEDDIICDDDDDDDVVEEEEVTERSSEVIMIDAAVMTEKVEMTDDVIQACPDVQNQMSSAIPDVTDAGTEPLGVQCTETHVQASVMSANASTDCHHPIGKDSSTDSRDLNVTKEASTECLEVVVKDAGTECVDVVLKDAEMVTEAVQITNSVESGVDGIEREAQTILKGWMTASMDVSVQQSNGSYKVQNLDIEGIDNERVAKPLRMWFPPTNVETSMQTDIRGWLESDMDVITQGEDGSYYLKKEKEHAAAESDRVYRPYRVHRASQVRWIGNQSFHKATQTSWDGSAKFHKATQYPDPTKSEEQMGQSIMYTLDKGCPVGMAPTVSPYTVAPTVTSLLATHGLPSTEEEEGLSKKGSASSMISTATVTTSTVTPAVAASTLPPVAQHCPTALVQSQLPIMQSQLFNQQQAQTALFQNQLPIVSQHQLMQSQLPITSQQQMLQYQLPATSQHQILQSQQPVTSQMMQYQLPTMSQNQMLQSQQPITSQPQMLQSPQPQATVSQQSQPPGPAQMPQTSAQSAQATIGPELQSVDMDIDPPSDEAAEPAPVTETPSSVNPVTSSIGEVERIITPSPHLAHQPLMSFAGMYPNTALPPPNPLLQGAFQYPTLPYFPTYPQQQMFNYFPGWM